MNPAVGTLIAVFAGVVVATALYWWAGIRRWSRPFRRSTDRLPSVSVIVAGRNEADFLRRCLESIVATDYPHELREVCYVDDQSTDGSLQIARAMAGVRTVEILATPTGWGPKKWALTQAIAATQGEILVFTDADSAVSRGWLKEIVAAYDEHTGAVAGAPLPAPGSGLGSRLYALERLLVAYTSASAIGHGAPASVSGQNFSFRRRVFEQIGSYPHRDVSSGDDDLMVQEIARRGWTVRYMSTPVSVVEDLRPPLLARQLHAATRHQSTVKYYPLRWRVIYLLSILAGLLSVAGIVAMAYRPSLILLIAPVILAKCLIDAIGVRTFARRLGLRYSSADMTIGFVLLPLYVIIRPVFAFLPRYTWQQRSHRRAAAASAS